MLEKLHGGDSGLWSLEAIVDRKRPDGGPERGCGGLVVLEEGSGGAEEGRRRVLEEALEV